MAKKQTKEAQEHIDMKQNYLRALADYQNLERRTAEQIGQIRKIAEQRLLLQFLDVEDDIERAEVFVKDEGLALVKSKIYKILEDSGVKALDLLGKDFDPYTAECIELVEGQENKVVKELQKGYALGEEILRPAKVAVGKAK